MKVICNRKDECGNSFCTHSSPHESGRCDFTRCGYVRGFIECIPVAILGHRPHNQQKTSKEIIKAGTVAPNLTEFQRARSSLEADFESNPNGKPMRITPIEEEK